MTTLCVLGLGSMDGRIAAALAAAGTTIRGYDPVTAARTRAGQQGVEVCETGNEAVADVIVLSPFKNCTAGCQHLRRTRDRLR